MSCTSLKFFLNVHFRCISLPPLLQRLDKTLICFTSQEVGFFFKVTHSQLVTGWELPRIPFLPMFTCFGPLMILVSPGSLSAPRGLPQCSQCQHWEIPCEKVTLTSISLGIATFCRPLLEIYRACQQIKASGKSCSKGNYKKKISPKQKFWSQSVCVQISLFHLLARRVGRCT